MLALPLICPYLITEISTPLGSDMRVVHYILHKPHRCTSDSVCHQKYHSLCCHQCYKIWYSSCLFNHWVIKSCSRLVRTDTLCYSVNTAGKTGIVGKAGKTCKAGKTNKAGKASKQAGLQATTGPFVSMLRELSTIL